MIYDSANDEFGKKPGRTSQETPNVAEHDKGKKQRGIVKDERGQEQPATKEDAKLGAGADFGRNAHLIQAIWWV